MSPSKEVINRLIQSGLEPLEAAVLFAHAALESTLKEQEVSSHAMRQRRYRERHQASPSVTDSNTSSVTKCHESVTSDASPNVTNRHESVTRDATSLSSLNNIESKKERESIQRHEMPLDWKPSLEAVALAREKGISVSRCAAAFRLWLKETARTFPDYDARFERWLLSERNMDGESNADYEPQIGYHPTEKEFERAAANFAKNNSLWGKSMGPEPGMIGCMCPHTILIRHGIDPKNGLRLTNSNTAA